MEVDGTTVSCEAAGDRFSSLPSMLLLVGPKLLMVSGFIDGRAPAKDIMKVHTKFSPPNVATVLAEIYSPHTAMTLSSSGQCDWSAAPLYLALSWDLNRLSMW